MDKIEKVVLSNSLFDFISEEEIQKLNRLTQYPECQLLMRIAQKDFSLLLGSQLINSDLSSDSDLSVIRLNQIYVDAVKKFLSWLTRTSKWEMVSYFDDEYIMPNYKAQSDINLDMSYKSFIDKWISWEESIWQ